MLKRYIWAPWLFATVVMYALSFIWHGIALTDLEELTIPRTLYFVLALLVYAVLGLGLTIGTQKAIQYEWISLKSGFPFYAIMIGAAVGFFAYLVIFVLGISFAKNGMMHMMVDVLWQMFEQGMGGLAVSLGIIYDLRQTFLENEQSV